jgi:nucleoside-diphosphate-sugar epimerase
METSRHVFVTGASSELMQEVLKRLDSSKYTASGLTRTPEHLVSDRVSWVVGEINQPESYKTELAKADIIIHAAAITHSKKPTPYFKVNVEGTQCLINAIPQGKDPLFVFISSRVAGEESGAYGVSKLRAEEEVKKLNSWVVIRPSEVFGGSKAEGIDKTIRSAIEGGAQLCPVGVESKMFPIHLNDTAEGIFQAAVDGSAKNQTLILNGRSGYSFSELLTLIEKLSGKRMTIIPIPKWLLGLVGLLAKVTPFDFGFVPDQVPRLYSTKTHGSSTEETISLESYIQELLKERNA